MWLQCALAIASVSLTLANYIHIVMSKRPREKVSEGIGLASAFLMLAALSIK